MIFSELYGAYYNAMAKIIDKAIAHPLEKGELSQIVSEYAFGESVMNIEAAIKEERWQLIKKDGTTPLVNSPTMPLTTLQKRWLKAISLDPRMRLFGDELQELDDVEPLFTQDDYCIFDRYADGDPYEDEGYISNFRLILDAIKNRYPLKVKMHSRTGREVYIKVIPEKLEYSEKDDKFRMIGTGRRYKDTINLARIISCKKYEGEYEERTVTRSNKREKEVIFELYDERKALDRVLLHFAHFKKQVEKIDEKAYRVAVAYDEDDEKEIVIRILSFGPMVKVTAPEEFVELVKLKLIGQMKQRSCEH